MTRLSRLALRLALLAVLVLVFASAWQRLLASLAPPGYAPIPIRATLERQWSAVSRSWRKRSDDYRAQGKELYERHCASCHGLSGEGGRGPNLAARGTTLSDDALGRIIREGVPGSGMPPFDLALDEEQRFQVIAHLAALREVPFTVGAGVAARGEELFRGKGKCHSCHDPRADSGGLGPDLSTVGVRRGSQYLRQKLVDPGREVADQDVPVYVELKTGESVTGTTVNGDTFSVQIRARDGRVHSFDRDELAIHRVERQTSFMPSYRAVFDDAELDDLVAYLSTLGRDR